MNFDKTTLERLLREACANVGHTGALELPTNVAAEFARLISIEHESALRTAACVLTPALQMLTAMDVIGGPPGAVEDVKRGSELLALAI